MKNNILFLILGGVIVFILMRSCKSETITIPAKQGTLKVTDTVTITKIVNKPVLKTLYKDLIKEVEKEKIMYQTLNVYQKDSVCSEMFELKEYKTRLSNKDLTADISVIHQGKIRDVKLNYLIPEVEVKQKNFSLSGGLGTDFNAQMPVLKVGVGYKNYKFDYLKINNQNFGVISYEIKF
jgi:flagellar biosynthesis protein FliP